MHGGGMEWARSFAKKHPKYVYSRRHGMLLHEIAKMEFQWWQLGDSGKYWVRRTSPRVTYTTKCGHFFFGPDPESKYAKDKPPKVAICELPKPDAVLCGRCRGESAVFARGCQTKPGGPTRQQAKARLGCVAEIK
jgi:hypothetical protein